MIEASQMPAAEKTTNGAGSVEQPAEEGAHGHADSRCTAPLIGRMC